MDIQIKRVYAAPEESDGIRVLVDRIWPRGIKKEALQAEQWLKDLAPSTALRSWFGHDPARWDEFCRRYFAELASAGTALEQLRSLAATNRLTLLYAARDETYNNAAALKEFLEKSPGA